MNESNSKIGWDSKQNEDALILPPLEIEVNDGGSQSAGSTGYAGLTKTQARICELLWQGTTQECREKMEREYPCAIKAIEEKLGRKLCPA